MSDLLQSSADAATMPSSFSGRLASELISVFGTDMMQVQLILPGTGAIPKIRQALQEVASGKALLLPRILSLDAFVSQLSGIERANSEKCLLHLFHSFRKHHNPEESLAAFLPLGQQLLSDFELIIRAGRRPDQVFAAMQQWEGTGAAFADFMDEEQKLLMKNFSGLFRDNLSDRRARFLRLWENLPAVFRSFEETLLAEGLGTSAMQYRNAFKALKDWNFEKPVQFYFAGFSSLSRLESDLFTVLFDRKLADFAWDILPEFSNKHGHEIRRLTDRLRAIPSFRKSLEKWTSAPPFKEKPQIRQINCPGLSGMAQWILSEPFVSQEEAVIILSDPALIQLLAGKGNLANGKELRFSMGFPLAYTPLARFFYKIIRWILRRNDQQGNLFLAILEDQHFSIFFPEASLYANQHLVHNPNPEIGQIRALPSLPSWFFPGNPVDFVLDFTEWLQQVKGVSGLDEMMLASIRKLEEIFREIKGVLHLVEDEWTFHVLQSFLQSRFQSAALFFKSEGHGYVEAMGLYESRLLNFKRIIIAPGDEGLFPSATNAQTLLPESVRRAFQLPLREEAMEEQAWQFYRLCRSAEEVVFLVTGSLEKRRSRFLDQIELEGIYPFRKEEIQFSSALHSSPKIQMMRNEKQMERVLAYHAQAGIDNPVRKFSPSSLHSLISCPLRFHYQKVMGLKAPERFSLTDMDVLDYGNFVHGGIQLLMEQHGKRGQLLKPVDYEQMAGEWDAVAPSVWKDLPDKKSIGSLEFFPLEAALGKIMAGRFFDFMKRQAPHRWLRNEYDFPDLKLSKGSYEWLLTGRADIILEEEKTFRILDLKTGAFKTQKQMLLRTESDGGLRESQLAENKDLFQMLAYNRMAANDSLFQGKKVAASLMYLANPKTELATPLEKVIERNEEPTFYERLDELLTRHLERFMDANEMVAQTPDSNICTFCDFNAMCRR